MVVYFDKDNCINYLKTFDEIEDGTDTFRMIKNQLNVHLNFSLDELDEYELILLEGFQQGVSEDFKITYGENKIARPLNRNSIPSKSGIYLLNDKNIQPLREQRLVIIAGVGEEVSTLKSLIINGDYSFHFEKVIGTDITAATHLNILNFPFSTLVVVDRYMFKGPEVGGNLGLYSYNLEKLLKNSYQDKKGPSRLIFVYQVNTRVAKTNPSYDEGPDLTKLANKLKSIPVKHCPTPEIYFIGVPSGFIEDEHDRFIISDYLRIKSGDCLVYFDSVGALKTKSKTVDFYSLGKKDYRKVTTILLQKITSIIQETLDKHPNFSKVPIGTQSNQVINFN